MQRGEVHGDNGRMQLARNADCEGECWVKWPGGLGMWIEMCKGLVLEGPLHRFLLLRGRWVSVRQTFLSFL